MIRRVAFALLVGGLLPTGAFGQAPPPLIAKPADPAPPTPAPAAAATATGEAKSFREPLPTDPAHPNYHAAAHRSIMRHNPLPQRTSFQGDNSSGSRNQNGGHYSTGGVGRVAEYYDDRTLNPAPNRFALPVAQFGNGGLPDRNEQIRAQQVGQQRTANIQNNINAYGRPYGAMGAGFGYGLGLAGGGLYTYPY